MLKFSNNFKQAARRLEIRKQQMIAAHRQALNTTLDRAYTATVRELVTVKKVKRKDITRNRGRRGMIQKHPAGRTAMIPVAKLWIGTRRIVDGKPDRSGSLLKVFTSHGRRYTKGPLTGAHSKVFRARVGKHIGDFVRYPLPSRRSTKGRRSASHNLPIQEVAQGGRTPSGISLMPDAKDIGDKHVAAAMHNVFPTELKRQLTRRGLI